MQISKLYETKLECSSYNVTIDSTDTTVTLTLVDFNGSPVTNTAVTLKADKGYFTKAVGKTTTTYTDASATKTINATTDNNGKVVATWTASEWGLCTFSANNNNTQVNITGWKVVYSSSDGTVRVSLYEDNFFLKVSSHPLSINANSEWQDDAIGCQLLVSPKPDGDYYSLTAWVDSIYCRFTHDGVLQFKNTSSKNFNQAISCAITGKINRSS